MAAGRTGSHHDPRFVAALLSSAATARTVGGVHWRHEGPKHVGTIAVSVGSLDIEAARLEITTNQLRPAEPSVAYIADGGWIRRLCVNVEHRPFVGTHKHRLEPIGEEPYEPMDIPVVPLSPDVSPQSYREVVAAFAAECSIELGVDYRWTDPWGGE